MDEQTPIRVGVLYGGPSAEHEVSCASAMSMVRALHGTGRYQPVPIGVGRDRRMHLLPEEVLSPLLQPRVGVPPIEDRLPMTGPVVELAPGPDAEHARVRAVADPDVTLGLLDVVFPLMHGPFGEDGQVQALLEGVGVAYVGCGVTASAVGMDKIAMKRAMIAEGLPVTPHVQITEGSWAAASDPLKLVAGLRRPLYVKPASLGSSIGISRVTRDEEFAAAVTEALRHDSSVIVEQGVTGRELECAVLGGWNPEASCVGEVTVSGDWFDYEQKYFAPTDPMVVPAPLPDRITERIRELSVAAFLSAGCWGLARVDFLYDSAAEDVYVNELNTMPGFTDYSMYPKVWAAVGVGYTDLVDRLIALAFERHASKVRRAGAVAAS
jgi:D-alanine-D-alanine ligase